MTTKIKGQLEIDHERGVIYFHADTTGHTVLRICHLPVIPGYAHGGIPGTLLDITHMHGVSWSQTELKPWRCTTCDQMITATTEEHWSQGLVPV